MATQRQLANAIRALAMDAVEAANSGHPGMPMGMADAATALFTKHLKYDPADPHWPDRDRFVLSAGHGSMLIYALLHLTGYARPTIEEIRNFRQLSSPCAGHPENFMLAGVETTTGPLGQGLATAVGMAIAERHLNAVYGDELVDHRTYVIAGDGCLMEGLNHEAAGPGRAFEARPADRAVGRQQDHHRRLDRPQPQGGCAWPATTAMGWHTVECDGMDLAKVSKAIDEAIADPRPSLIRCKTIIGYGAPNKQGTAATHGSPLGADEVAAARKELGWDLPPFEIPDDVAKAWREAGARGGKARAEWHWRLEASGKAQEFRDRLAGRIDDRWLKPYLDALIANPPKVATRKASEMALEVINTACPWTIGGSADLTGSNNTKTKELQPLDPRELRRPLHLLRHPRVRHGRGDERHGAAWRRTALWRHLPGLFRL